MTYSLKFEKRALKEWETLGYPVKEQVKEKTGRAFRKPSCAVSKTKWSS